MQGKEKVSDERDVRQELTVAGDSRDMQEGLAAAEEGQDMREGLAVAGEGRDMRGGLAAVRGGRDMREGLTATEEGQEVREELIAAGKIQDMRKVLVAAEKGQEAQGKDIGMQEEGKEAGKEGAQAGLERELMAQLEWYAMHVADPEYDAKAVESILYLLDNVAPLEEGTVPPKEEAWERFLAIADSQGEILPLEHGVDGLRVDADAGESAGVGAGKGGRLLKFRRFVVRHKMIAAAVLVVMILAVGGSIQAGARRGEGFFFWLKEDDSGKTMITLPENLNNETNRNESIFYDNSELPMWAQEWSQIENQIEMIEEYKWDCYEISEFENFQMVISHYQNEEKKESIVVGMTIYQEKISYNKDRYANYTYVQGCEITDRHIDVYSKKEESGKIYYIVCSYKDNYEYFIEGFESLDVIKKMMEEYLEKIKI